MYKNSSSIEKETYVSPLSTTVGVALGSLLCGSGSFGAKSVGAGNTTWWEDDDE